jgi:hypothetical protein
LSFGYSLAQWTPHELTGYNFASISTPEQSEVHSNPCPRLKLLSVSLHA